MKSQTLKLNKDFRRVYYRGKKDAGSCLVTYILRNNTGGTRIGITSGKKIGNAVKRNRARRLIRAAFCACEDRLCGSYDIVFVARSRTAEVKMDAVLKQMRRQLANLGAIKKDEKPD